MSTLLEEFFLSTGVSTDTRTLLPGQLYFALSGENFNGNHFAIKALELGASAAVVSDPDLQGDRLIHVPDPLSALQLLAKAYRLTLSIPVIAIAGSNGKTTTKELTGMVANSLYNCFVTVGNLNNHIGVPLSLLSIGRQHKAAIIELGANRPGDYTQLCEICAPEAILVTNIGKDHLEGFGGIFGVVEAHRELADYLLACRGILFVNSSDPSSIEVMRGVDNKIEFNQGEVRLISIPGKSTVSYCRVAEELDEEPVTTRLMGTYNLSNIAAALAIGKYLGVPSKIADRAIAKYEPGNNRSQEIKTKKGNTLIADCYNSNPSSAEAALRSLASTVDVNSFFILGDMFELGAYEYDEHKAIAGLASELGLRGYFVGPRFAKVLADSPDVFVDKHHLANKLVSSPLQNKHILLKASRGLALESLIELL